MIQRQGYHSLCNTCSHKPCCTECISPLVFSEDRRRLEKIDKNYSDYLDTISIEGIKTTIIKKRPQSTECVFWDKNDKKCSVYENRPFDCKIFPFDIIQKDGKFFWIVFECNPGTNWRWTESHLDALEADPAFSDFIKNIYVYSSLRISEFDNKKTNFSIIRQVRFPKQIITHKAVTPVSKRSTHEQNQDNNRR